MTLEKYYKLSRITFILKNLSFGSELNLENTQFYAIFIHRGRLHPQNFIKGNNLVYLKRFKYGKNILKKKEFSHEFPGSTFLLFTNNPTTFSNNLSTLVKFLKDTSQDVKLYFAVINKMFLNNNRCLLLQNLQNNSLFFHQKVFFSLFINNYCLTRVFFLHYLNKISL